MRWSTKFKTKHGFTLVELVVALGIFSLVSSAFILLLNLSLRITTEDKARTGAMAVAEEKIEVIKNLPYNSIGTVGGVPSGSLPTSETVTLNKIDYTVRTNIQYVDDAYDGLITSGDLLNTDYKKVKIRVSWTSGYSSNNEVALVTNISPRNLEQESSGDTGTLWIEVYDSTPAAVAGASVHIVNNSTTPLIDIESTTDSDGKFLLPGMPVATQSYEITVTKDGYSTSQTYNVDPINNPNPDPAPLSVGVESITTKSFFIDKVSTLNITTQPNFTFTLVGLKTIGLDGEGQPIYKYNQEQTVDSSGQLILNSLEPDTYNISFDPVTTGYDYAGSDPLLPLIISPDTNVNLEITLMLHSDHTFLITVEDPTGAGLAGASVHIYKPDLSTDLTQVTNAVGQTFFTPLTQDTFNLDISKEGYQTYSNTIEINGQTQQTFSLPLQL
jgi:prepilin-type N-terminal cleavage/methylation domain-containing protein